MSEYVLTIERREPNPNYAPPPARELYMSAYDQPKDDRTPDQREYYLTRVLSATLDAAEYETVKQAVIAAWDASK